MYYVGSETVAHALSTCGSKVKGGHRVAYQLMAQVNGWRIVLPLARTLCHEPLAMSNMGLTWALTWATISFLTSVMLALQRTRDPWSGKNCSSLLYSSVRLSIKPT